MNVLHGLANIFLIFVLVIQVQILHTQIQEMDKDLDSARLQTAIDNSTKYAFGNSLKISNLEQTYEDLNSFTVDPSNILDDFSLLMLKCYDLANTEENRQVVLDSIDGALLCDVDGYYLLQLADVPYAEYDNPTYYSIREYSNELYNLNTYNSMQVPFAMTSPQLKWSLKLPYYMEVDNFHMAMSLTNPDLIAIGGNEDGTDLRIDRVNGRLELETIKEEISHDGRTYEVDRNIYTGYYKKPWSEDYWTQEELNDDMKIATINRLLNRQFNASIDAITEAKGRTRNYTVYLPSETTRTGVNPIKNSCLLVAMSEVPFAPDAEIIEPSLAGYTAVTKQYIVGFQTDEGTYEYCYATQLPKEISDVDTDNIETFHDMTDAASSGYIPSLEYITRPIFR